jgi:hypothetical protein
MSHGETQAEPSTSNPLIEAIGSGNREGASQTVVPDDDPTAQEERTRVFERIELIMETFRKGESSRFKASTHVLKELDQWGGVTDKEKGKAYDSYLAEINSSLAIQDEEWSATRETSPPTGASLTTRRGGSKRVRDEVEELLDQVSRGGGPEADDDESKVTKRRVREDEMPWYDASVNSNRRSSCVETCRTLLRFSENLSGVKSLLRVANDLPEGIPSSQWDRMLRGESVDLNQILSSMHFIQLDEERKGRLGSAEVVFSVAESKRQIRTGSEWSSAFRRMSRAITFLFPHRREELLEYAEHVEGLFSAKQTSAHSKVILYDQSVRNQVGGGQNILLTDYHRFNALSKAILHADGVEYRGQSSGKGLSKGERSREAKKEVCRKFNGPGGCRFAEDGCYYKHLCGRCGKGGHGKTACPEEKH